jgi:hypothetical protein
MALLSSADAIAALTAAGRTAYKSPARANGRCQTLCYVVGGQPVNLGRLRQLAREVMGPAAATAEPVVSAEPPAAEPVVSAAPVGAPYDVARLGFATFNPETEGLSEDPADCYAPGTGPAPTGASLSGLPWDPGTPAARERVALQGERVAILWPIAQALRGAGVALPPSWATDGPVMAGELSLNAALALLPLGAIAQAATALAALPPVTTAQDLALTLCDTGAVPGRPYL